MPKVEIYTSGLCAYCVAAKNLLKQKGLDYSEIRIDTDTAQRDAMLARTHRRTVPQIFIAGEHIGGYDDLVAADHSGKLASILATAS
jgi:glutaredoxin 3